LFAGTHTPPLPIAMKLPAAISTALVFVSAATNAPPAEGCPFLDLYDQPQYHKNSEGVCQGCSKSPWYDTDHKCVCGASAADWITKDQWNPCYDQPQCLNADATTSDDVYKNCNIKQFAVTEIGREISTFMAAVLAGDEGMGGLWTIPTGDHGNRLGLTIFAPVNKAFKALPPGTLDNLLKPENKATLIDLLKNHVLGLELRSCPQGKPVTSACLQDYPVVKTYDGKTLHVVADATGKTCPQQPGSKEPPFTCVSVGPSLKDLKKQVLTSEFLLSNGVVYMIDGVLLPPSSAVDIMV